MGVVYKTVRFVVWLRFSKSPLLSGKRRSKRRRTGIRPLRRLLAQFWQNRPGCASSQPPGAPPGPIREAACSPRTPRADRRYLRLKELQLLGPVPARSLLRRDALHLVGQTDQVHGFRRIGYTLQNTPRLVVHDDGVAIRDEVKLGLSGPNVTSQTVEFTAQQTQNLADLLKR